MFLALHNDRVASIRTAACSSNHVEMLRQNIDRLPLPLVPPLRADDGGDGAEGRNELLHRIIINDLCSMSKEDFFQFFPISPRVKIYGLWN